MHLGPILRRELIVASRRQPLFSMRTGVAALMLLVVAGCIVGWSLTESDRTSIRGMAWWAQTAFGSALAIQAFAVLLVVIEDMAQALPRERERKTLDGLVASGLSSAGIVVGVLGAGLIHAVADMAAGLPIMLLMVPLMGIDWRLIVLGYAALGATAFAVAALALAVSAGVRNRRSASMRAGMAMVAWYELPLLFLLARPLVWPAGRAWVTPVAVGLLDTSPAGLIATVVGLVPRGDPVGVALRMIAYEVAIGLGLVAWAIVRLRPVCRSLADVESGALAGLRRRAPRRRPPCGEDAMLWKERYATRGPGLEPGVPMMVLFLGGFGLASLYFAWYALRELIARGYGVSAGDSAPDGVFEWAVIVGRGIPLTTGHAREVFNLVVREITLVFSLLLAFVATDASVMSIVQERDQNTWPGLMATPLSAWEMLRAKVIGVCWKLRWALSGLVGLWTIGLVVGSVHPLGFVAGLVMLLVASGFIIVLGTTRALRSDDRKRATDSCIFVMVLLTFSGLLPRVLPEDASSALLGAGSVPLLLWLALVSWHDVDTAFRTGVYPQLELLAFNGGEGASSVLGTLLIGLIGYALAIVLLTGAALRRFDADAGRAERPPG
jgi:hypothetical protein